MVTYDHNDDSDDEMFLLASQQYEEWASRESQQSLLEGESNEIEEKYNDMDEDNFLLDRLMPEWASQALENEDKLQQPGLEGDSGDIEMKCKGMDEDDCKLMPDDGSSSKKSIRFGNPVSEADILEKIDGIIPRYTKKTTLWSVKTWHKWAEHRQNSGSGVPPELDGISNADLNKWLAWFIVEARNQQGEEYRGGTLYSLCSGIQRYMREKRKGAEPLDIYKDSSFEFFRKAFDGTLKELRQKGIGTTVKRAEIISEEVEEKMWREGCLGDDTPKKLLDTLVFGFGMNYALRSGKEHRKLRSDMLELKEPLDGTPYLLYTEPGSKNRPGGLKDRKISNKSVKLFANVKNPSRCFVRMFQKYMSLRPSNAPKDVFYLKPLVSPQEHCWYSARPVGHNLLSDTVKRLCNQVGVSGHFTNHSLRRTCATRLFQSGIDEQQIMSVTGHRSIDAVRVYKEMPHDQEEQLSKIIQPQIKKPKPDDTHHQTIVKSRKKLSFKPTTFMVAML